MLLHSVIIILREVLEAALLISAMLSLSHYLKIPLTWLRWAITAGLLGAMLYAKNIGVISNWFEGVGQEICNAVLQYSIYILLIGFCITLIIKKQLSATILKVIAWIISTIIALSMIREFSEALIYLQIAIVDKQHMMGIILGAFLGAGIGLSIGIIFYHLLNYLSDKWSFNIVIIVLSFIASGMLSQATQLMTQADWISASPPVWDSSAWLSEQSVAGQLLYAVIGYEATPSLIQVVFYFSSLLLILSFIFFKNNRLSYKK